ncbi:arginyltransferase [Endozoicomonas ascidiicola]|uniref:arginyltransferase n=1 Tax=Endozoicomonas ascidiicola TaxID=1698521 RepID=UPI00082A7FE0|nr:arginyltransferase [Endozoicomonas ascidiicola]
MSEHKNIKFYATQPHQCSYLPDEEATTLFIDPNITTDQALCSNLSNLGFRRSGQHLYRPHCNQCNACIASRIPATDFSMRRTQRKVWSRNSDLKVEKRTPEYCHEHYDLYEQYINQCHHDGDMYPATVEQYSAFLIDNPGFTSFYEFRLQGELLAVSVVDELQNAFSAIYTYYSPKYSNRSLGKYCILWLIHQAKQQQIDYVHLGYWIKNSQKMNYKIEFRPIELYINQQWQLLK